MVDQTIKDISEHIESVQCPKHGKYPTVKVTSKDFDDIHLEVSGCCRENVEKALEGMNGNFTVNIEEE